MFLIGMKKIIEYNNVYCHVQATLTTKDYECKIFLYDKLSESYAINANVNFKSYLMTFLW